MRCDENFFVQSFNWNSRNSIKECIVEPSNYLISDWTSYILVILRRTDYLRLTTSRATLRQTIDHNEFIYIITIIIVNSR